MGRLTVVNVFHLLSNQQAAKTSPHTEVQTLADDQLISSIFDYPLNSYGSIRDVLCFSHAASALLLGNK